MTATAILSFAEVEPEEDDEMTGGAYGCSSSFNESPTAIHRVLTFLLRTIIEDYGDLNNPHRIGNRNCKYLSGSPRSLPASCRSRCASLLENLLRLSDTLFVKRADGIEAVAAWKASGPAQ